MTTPNPENDPFASVIDALIPRGKKPAGILIPLDPFLSRLFSLHDKCLAVLYRRKRWDAALQEHEERFKQLCPSLESPALAHQDGSAWISFSLTSFGLASELEALLSAVRSALDVLGRVVAATRQGGTDSHSYADLKKWLVKNACSNPLTPVVAEAFTKWIDELRERRDQFTHRNALLVHSARQASGGGEVKASPTEIVAQIPKDSKLDLSTWLHPGISMEGLEFESTQFVRPGERPEELHSIKDSLGHTIIAKTGPLPKPPETIDARSYVRDLLFHFQTHIHAVLGTLNRIVR